MLKTVSSITNAIGALNYKGTWDANANSPALTSSVGTKGDYYVVSTAGSTTLNGISNWGVGDWAAFNGSVWQRVEGGANLNGVDLSVSGTSTLSGLTASTALALNASKEVVSVTNTGTGNNVLASSPSIATPTLTGDVQMSTGNLVVGTSGKGIDFSITSHPAGMTSELFADYEEGTFTPTAGPVTLTSATGKYTKVGRAVHFEMEVVFPVTASTAGAGLGGLPFTVSANNYPCAVWTNRGSSIFAYVVASSTDVNLYSVTTGGIYDYVDFSADSVKISGTYFV
jgi:hypothetical protein